MRKIDRDRVGEEWGEGGRGRGDQVKSKLRPGFRRKCEWCRKNMRKSIFINRAMHQFLQIYLGVT